MELKIGILYLSLHNQLKKKYGVNVVMTRKDLYYKLGYEHKLPKPVRAIAMNELIKMKLLEKIDRDNIKILDYDIDINTQEGLNKLCQMARIF